jgi:hypothetical protein
MLFRYDGCLYDSNNLEQVSPVDIEFSEKHVETARMLYQGNGKRLTGVRVLRLAFSLSLHEALNLWRFAEYIEQGGRLQYNH